MTNLTHAHDELYRRQPDEHFATMQDLTQHCQKLKEESQQRWHSPESVTADASSGRLMLRLGSDEAFAPNDWSFGQICRLARVSKDTVNRVNPETAERVLHDTLPNEGKPWQFLTNGNRIRAVHPASYTRLYNLDLLTMVHEFATDFRPPQEADGGGNGLYCGEQDMFCFLIDPLGWAEIEGQAFAPGFFIWNSEVGRRSVGVQTFWFQAVCQNHIVWDALEIVEFNRKHTANVHESISEIRRIIHNLVEKRDARRYGFVSLIQRAMHEKFGSTNDDALKILQRHGITRRLAEEALKIARQQGGLTVFSVVDALTRLAGKVNNAGDRVELDLQAGRLLSLSN